MTLLEQQKKQSENDDLEEEYKRIEREYRQRQADQETTDDQPFRRTNTSAYYRSLEKKRKRYTPSAEELVDDQDIKGDSSDDGDQIVTGRDADDE